MLTPCFTLCRVLQSMTGGLRPCRSCSLCTPVVTGPVGVVVGDAAASLRHMPTLW